MVEAQVVVAPIRHARMPFQNVAGQIEVEEFDFLLDRLGEPVVHGGHDGGAGHQRVMFGLGSRVAGVDAEDVGALAAGRVSDPGSPSTAARVGAGRRQ